MWGPDGSYLPPIPPPFPAIIPPSLPAKRIISAQKTTKILQIRKPKTEPSPTAMFTRSKSLIYIGRNRSGRKRHLITATTLGYLESPRGKPRGRYCHQNPAEEDEISHTSIKDLRAHRVFSCNSDNDKAEMIENELDYSDGKVSFEGKIGVESLSPDRNVNDSMVDDDGYLKAATAEVNVGFCDDENIQMTPPDADIFSKPRVDEGGGDGAQCVFHSADNVVVKQPCGNIPRKESTKRSRLVLNPCSRLKLFKTPGSFSYRRLLPYLMDIAKDNSCVSRNIHCRKPEMGLEEKLHPSLLASHNDEICKAKNSPVEDNGAYSGKLCTGTLAPSKESVKDKEPDLVSPGHISGCQVSFDSQREESQAKQFISYESRELEPPNVNFTVISGTDELDRPPCTVSCEALLGSGVTEVPHHLPADMQENYMIPQMELTTDVKSSDIVNFGQTSLQLETLIPPGIPEVGHGKGILKRNPRGCRGLCTCLNCASFRLHAERAFEFSRNQMQDAKEVAVELMKELSYLRNMLEKSADGTNDHAFVHINQVKDACEKASKAEELAKDRLRQMNYDLDIHCRITCLHRPRVTFSDYVDERLIAKTGLCRK